MAEKQSFVMHMMWAEIFENLPKEKAGELIQAIYAFQKTGESPINDPVLSAVFEMMRTKMEDDADKYWKQVERNRENGHKGGRPRKTHNNPQKPSGFLENPVGGEQNPVGGHNNPQKPDTDTDNDTDNDIDNVTDNEPKGTNSIAKAMHSTPQADYSAVLQAYNQTCVSFPRISVMSDTRKKAVRARLRTGYTMEDFETVFRKAEASDFLKGKNDRNWSATFDWLIRDANMAKVLDGNYDNKASPEGLPETNNPFLRMLWEEGENK